MKYIFMVLFLINLAVSGYVLYKLNSLVDDTGEVFGKSGILSQTSDGKLLINRVVTAGDMEQILEGM